MCTQWNVKYTIHTWPVWNNTVITKIQIYLSFAIFRVFHNFDFFAISYEKIDFSKKKTIVFPMIHYIIKLVDYRQNKNEFCIFWFFVRFFSFFWHSNWSCIVLVFIKYQTAFFFTKIEVIINIRVISRNVLIKKSNWWDFRVVRSRDFPGRCGNFK